MSQPIAGYSWVNVGTVNGGAGAGTVLVTNRSTTLVRVVFPGTYVGTVNFYDAAGTAGTAGSNWITSFGLPATSVGGYIEIGAECKRGLVYEATGTPILTFLYN